MSNSEAMAVPQRSASPALELTNYLFSREWTSVHSLTHSDNEGDIVIQLLIQGWHNSDKLL